MYKKLIVPLVTVYLFTEITLGVLMHTSTTFSLYAYASVVLAFLMNLILFLPKGRNIATLVALAFTLGADYFLVLRGDSYVTAMFLFSVAQLAYAARIYIESGKKLRTGTLIVRPIVALISVLAPYVVLGEGADMLAVISVFYFGQLILNCTFAFINSPKGGLLLPVALLLFLFCDIFVGFGNLGGYIPIEPGSFAAWLAYPPINMAWVFYLPSQALLGMSMLRPPKN